jgi:hypothetical protein
MEQLVQLALPQARVRMRIKRDVDYVHRAQRHLRTGQRATAVMGISFRQWVFAKLARSEKLLAIRSLPATTSGLLVPLITGLF